MRYTPARPLTQILSPAYDPCCGFKGACKGTATWAPGEGHVPRGFIGALGTIKEVEVVILLAEPGHPLPDEAYRERNKLSRTCRYTFKALETGAYPFHRNLKYLLDRIFRPTRRLECQLRKAWITETYLCSIPRTTEQVPPDAERECADRYLDRQLALLEGLPIIALGGKAQKRAQRYTSNLIRAHSPARPGANQRGARPSWDEAAKQARRIMQRRSR